MSPTIELVHLITEIKLPSGNLINIIFNVDHLVFAICESIMEIIDQKENSQLKSIENWFNILLNLIKMNLLKFYNGTDDENFKKINTVILKILHPYQELCNLVPNDEKSLACIHRCTFLLTSFQKNEMLPNTELIHSLLLVTINLKTGNINFFIS